MSPETQRRGEDLRRHILLTAKDVFLEAGFERASMDAVAARAGTSKRSLYAHFASKDLLFDAVQDLVRELFLGRLRTPEAYAGQPAEAVALFCARLLQLLVWEPQLRNCRLTVAAAERVPGSATAYYDIIFTNARRRLGAYLTEAYGTPAGPAADLSGELVDRTVLPRLMRTLLAVEEPIRHDPEPDALAADVDLAAVRRLVAGLLPAGGPGPA